MNPCKPRPVDPETAQRVAVSDAMEDLTLAHAEEEIREGRPMNAYDVINSGDRFIADLQDGDASKAAEPSAPRGEK